MKELVLEIDIYGNVEEKDFVCDREEKLKFPVYFTSDLMEVTWEKLELSCFVTGRLQRKGFYKIGDLLEKIESIGQKSAFSYIGRQNFNEILMAIFCYQIGLLDMEGKKIFLIRVLKLNSKKKQSARQEEPETMENPLIKEILSILFDMDDEQVKNVYDYVCDEYTEKNHEANNYEVIRRLEAENERYKMKEKE